ncbi:cytochrome d ubiquinol oxidase subunit II [Paenibacillus guangzhouensis]|uniref:cytochrome d ubiquinol oxidase subunit II n=1 Tax=Paenibacillus guangzhouensis TaxID=1473112 RepID=UPI001266F95D|nr:cytochrome d ubiquinol oxidase subunit II [Paenibacillus guangzhouensis]
MSYEILGITVLWIFLYGYLIVASIDFGAGFYSFFSLITGKRHRIHPIVERYLTPVWEVTNVFLVFFFVGIIGFFPETAYYYGTSLLVPGSIAIVLLAIRGVYYVYSQYGNRNNKFYMFLYGVSGLLIPASLSIVLTLSEGGYIHEQGGVVSLDYHALFTSAYSWSVVVLAIVSVLYISAMFLTYYAAKAKDKEALDILRSYALFWSVPTILCSLWVFFAIQRHNLDHFNKMVDNAWFFIASFICYVIAVYLVWKRSRLQLSFVMVMLQFGFAFFGYGKSHLPYILVPYLTLHEHFTNESMALALVIVFLLGLLVLVPSLYLLLRLFLFDASYVRGKLSKK